MPFGTEIIISDHLPKRADWSSCRSPSRAKWRHRQGHKQHVTYHDQSFMTNGRAVITNRTMQALRDRIDADIFRLITTGESVTQTYLTPDDDIAILTVDKLRDSMKKLNDDYPDIFEYPKDMSWPFLTKNKYSLSK